MANKKKIAALPQTTAVTVRLSNDMLKKLDIIGDQYGLNRPSLIRAAIMDLLRKESAVLAERTVEP